MLQGKFYSVAVSLTWIIAAASLCSCQPIVNRHPQRRKVLFEDRLQEKNNLEFLLSLNFPRGQDLIRTVKKHQVFPTAGQLCKWSFWFPFQRTEAELSSHISRQSLQRTILTWICVYLQNTHIPQQQLLNMRSSGRYCHPQNYSSAVKLPHCLYQVLKNVLRCWNSLFQKRSLPQRPL